MHFIEPSLDDISRALESWQWVSLEAKQPILVTAFGDIFFASNEGIWFLDTIEGSMTRVCDTRDELAANAELQKSMAALNSDFGDTAYVSPTYFGHDLIVISKRRLSLVDTETISSAANELLSKSREDGTQPNQPIHPSADRSESKPSPDIGP